MSFKKYLTESQLPTLRSFRSGIPLFRISIFALLLCSLSAVACSGGAKNIILMVPDGMGLANVTAARIYRYGRQPVPLNFETLEHIGYQRNFSANSIITDSAAAASAWACGEKFANEEVCFHKDGRATKPSILELARNSGRSTGLVVTDSISGATPAAFGAHVGSRDCQQEIARQYIAGNGVDVLFGGGLGIFTSDKPDSCGSAGNLLQLAQEKGYVTVFDRYGMNSAVAEGATKLLGLFHDRALTPECRRTPETGEPRLPEMAAAALKVLEKDPDGFFLLIEGSLVDKANHKNDFPFQVGEVLAFDEAAAVVRKWIDADPKRKGETLLIVVPDHETGGFAITGPVSAGGDNDHEVEVSWTGTDHTGVDTIIWSSGPGSERLGRAIDNTDLYGVMADALK
jgi:alkaline phosphatase